MEPTKKENKLRPSLAVLFLLLFTQSVFSADLSCKNLFSEVKAMPLIAGTWRKLIDSDTIYRFKNSDAHPSVAMYNWGPGIFSTNSIDSGISGKNLISLFKFKGEQGQGLYIANEPVGRAGHGDTLMEVILYKDNRPVQTENGEMAVSISSKEFSVDGAGSSDFLSLSTANGMTGGGHIDYVVKDPRVIKALRWPSKEFLFKNLKDYYAYLHSREYLTNWNYSASRHDIVALPPFVNLASQIFVSKALSAADRREFLNSEMAKLYVENTWEFNYTFWTANNGFEKMDSSLSGNLRAFDNFFKATVDEGSNFLFLDNRVGTFSYTTLIERASLMTRDQVLLLKSLIPNGVKNTKSLQQPIALAVALGEHRWSEARHLLMTLNDTLEEGKKSKQSYSAWRIFLRMYEPQRKEMDRAIEYFDKHLHLSPKNH